MVSLVLADKLYYSFTPGLVQLRIQPVQAVLDGYANNTV